MHFCPCYVVLSTFFYSLCQPIAIPLLPSLAVFLRSLSVWQTLWGTYSIFNYKTFAKNLDQAYFSPICNICLFNSMIERHLKLADTFCDCRRIICHVREKSHKVSDMKTKTVVFRKKGKKEKRKWIAIENGTFSHLNFWADAISILLAEFFFYQLFR